MFHIGNGLQYVVCIINLHVAEIFKYFHVIRERNGKVSIK